MNVTDRHPAPWRLVTHGPDGTMYDANGKLVGETGDGSKREEDLERLLLAAPELLAEVKNFVALLGQIKVESQGTGVEWEPTALEVHLRALIERIEGAGS